jgi:peroxisomal 3,2-trans-enoyl-CoA isomerase
MSSSIISVDYRGRIAVVSINNTKKLNVLSQQQYFELASRMREIATHDEVFITVIIARGRYFSAYVPAQCRFFVNKSTHLQQWLRCWQ